jgi:hypothetical protein
MISRAGHIALILPDFAQPPIPTAKIGIYRYLGNKEWSAVPATYRKTFLHIGV